MFSVTYKGEVYKFNVPPQLIPQIIQCFKNVIYLDYLIEEFGEEQGTPVPDVYIREFEEEDMGKPGY